MRAELEPTGEDMIEDVYCCAQSTDAIHLMRAVSYAVEKSRYRGCFTQFDCSGPR